MPVHHHLPKEGMLYQREQYAKGGVSRTYRDYKKRVLLSFVREEHRTIFDLGCGEGLVLEEFRAAFPDREVRGVDLDEENVEICRRHGLDAILGDVTDLPLDQGSADLCLLVDVLEHLDAPEAAVREVARVLRPGGRLIVVIPNDRNFLLARIAAGKLKEAFYDAGHLRTWSPRQTAALLSSSGFSVVARNNIPLPLWLLSLHAIVVADRRG